MRNVYTSNFVMVVIILLLAAVLIIGDLSTGSTSSVSKHVEDENSRNSYTISPTLLSDESKKLIEAVSRGSVYVFDVEGIEDSVISVWVEQYEKGGELKYLYGPTGNNVQKDEDGKIRIVFSYDYQWNMNQGKNEQVLYIMDTIMSKGYLSKGYVEVPLTNVGSRTWWALDAKRESPLHQPVTVLTVVEDSDHAIIVSPFWSEEYDRTGVLPKELADVDRVLFFRIMLGDTDKYNLK